MKRPSNLGLLEFELVRGMRTGQSGFPIYPQIDILRALAAILVLVYHVIVVGQWSDFPQSEPWRLFYIGWIGVDLFFVISGFVITLSAANEINKAPCRKKFYIAFFRRRLARIVPLYLLTGIVFLFL